MTSDALAANFEAAIRGAHAIEAPDLATLRAWDQDQSGTGQAGRYRLAIWRDGVVSVLTSSGTTLDEPVLLRSASKSLYGCGLAQAIAEGHIGSLDDLVVDYYPDLLDVPPTSGPKPDSYSRPSDRLITFRHLISNTSGYLKPGEPPGEHFHYQTFGMNALTHAIARVYGLYDRTPDLSVGFGTLAHSWFREPIGATWTWEYRNFDLHPDARIEVFGNGTFFRASAIDMLRLGVLWLNDGVWGGVRLVPSGWMAQATRVPEIPIKNVPFEEQSYGLGFWTNERGRLWADLPADSFAAWGAGGQLIWVCPSLKIAAVISYIELPDDTFQTVPSWNDSVLSRLILGAQA